jgi:hypothetical protein
MKHLLTTLKFRYLVMIAAVLIINSCMSGKRLDIYRAVPGDLQGTYTLILYGCRYPGDLQNLVILYPDGGPITFEIHDLKTSYQVYEGIPADKALKGAAKFLSCNWDSWKAQLSKIVGPDGAIAGYELRTLYTPNMFGMADVLDVDYRFSDSKVTVYINLDPEIEKAIEYSGRTPHRF